MSLEQLSEQLDRQLARIDSALRTMLECDSNKYPVAEVIQAEANLERITANIARVAPEMSIYPNWWHGWADRRVRELVRERRT